jgi:hypothetical protein
MVSTGSTLVDNFRTFEWPRASDLKELGYREQGMTVGTVGSLGPVEDYFQTWHGLLIPFIIDEFDSR